jgi:proteic killer suppression protein
MIKTFRCRNTRRLFNGTPVKQFAVFERVAFRKLAQINASRKISDLSIVPGNNLEALKGNRAGQYSIRINDKWRICFVWNETNAYDVEIVDYH